MNKDASAVKRCGSPWPRLGGYLRVLQFGCVGLICTTLNGAGNFAIAQEPSQPAAKVGNCAGLGAQGVFEDITPPEPYQSTGRRFSPSAVRLRPGGADPASPQRGARCEGHLTSRASARSTGR